MKEKQIGIYSITCTVNGKQYVGQSIDIDRRKNQHRRNEENPRLRADIEKYGWDAFNFDVESVTAAAEFCKVPGSTLSMLLAGKGRTAGGYHWIWVYDDPEQEKVALERIAQMPEGHKHTDATREKQRQVKLGKKMSPECCAKMRESHTGKKWKKSTYEKLCRRIRCVETNDIFFSIKDAAEEYGLSAPNISVVLNGTKKTAGGYHWEYMDGRPPAPRSENMRRKVSKAVRCVETGEIFYSIHSAAESCGVTDGAISAVLRGRNEKSGGYHWERV